MVEKATPHGPLSVREYLALEKSATVRHEYVAGETYALAGASDRHNRISGNIFARLWGAARGGTCRIYMSDMKLRASENIFYYPDVMVVCGPPEPGNPDFQRDPCLVVEVLSPSTEQIDRREKLLAYENIPSVGAYLVVSQDIRRVERHFRDEDGLWRKADLVDRGRFSVPCPPGTELTLDEVYEGL
jgi:Uma2 family endonuclease